MSVTEVELPICPANNHPATNRLLAQLSNWDGVEQCYEVHVPMPRVIEVNLPEQIDRDDTSEEWWMVTLEVHRFFNDQEGIRYGFSGGLGEGKVIFSQIR